MNQEFGLGLENLNIVTGHMCFERNIKDVPRNLKDENNYILLPYQKGEIRYFLEHIYTGLEMTAKDPNSLLIFSGGFTRKNCGKWSEALTYSSIAKRRCDLCSDRDCDVPKRIVLEELALDSFQNLKNSREIFQNMTGKNPTNISVIGWEFKRDRFNFHRETLGIPESDFTYIGVNNPTNLEDALKGEIKTIENFRNNPWGNSGELLYKRMERDVKELRVAA